MRAVKRSLKVLCLSLLVVLAVVLASCGGDSEDDPVLGRFTGECPKGPLAFWDCNMTWNQECWQ